MLEKSWFGLVDIDSILHPNSSCWCYIYIYIYIVYIYIYYIYKDIYDTRIFFVCLAEASLPVLVHIQPCALLYLHVLYILILLPVFVVIQDPIGLFWCVSWRIPDDYYCFASHLYPVGDEGEGVAMQCCVLHVCLYLLYKVAPKQLILSITYMYI